VKKQNNEILTNQKRKHSSWLNLLFILSTPYPPPGKPLPPHIAHIPITAQANIDIKTLAKSAILLMLLRKAILN